MVKSLDYIFRIYRAALNLAGTYMKCSLYTMKKMYSDIKTGNKHDIYEDIELVFDPMLISLKILIYYPIYTIYRVHKFRHITLQKATYKWEDVRTHAPNSYSLYDVVLSREPYGL